MYSVDICILKFRTGTIYIAILKFFKPTTAEEQWKWAVPNYKFSFILLSFILLFPRLPILSVMTLVTTPVTVPKGPTSMASWPPSLKTPKLIMGFTISLLVNLRTNYTRLHFVLEMLRPVNAVVASMSQDTTYCNLVQTKRRLSIGLGTKNV